MENKTTKQLAKLLHDFDRTGNYTNEVYDLVMEILEARGYFDVDWADHD